MKKLLLFSACTLFAIQSRAQLITTYLCERVTAAGFSSMMVIHYGYDAANHVNSMVNQNWVNNTGWVNDYMQTYTNTPQGYPKDGITQDWSAATSSWTNQSKFTTTLSGSSPQTQITYYFANNSWAEGTQTVWQYDPLNSVVTETLMNTSGATATFTNYTRMTYTMTATGSVKQMVQDVWDVTLNVWTHNVKTVYGYNTNGSVAIETSYNWNGSAWDLIMQHDYQYSSNGMLLKDSTMFLMNGTWRNGNRYHYLYDFAGNRVQIDQYNWEVPANRFVYYFRYRSTYSPVSVPETEDRNHSIHAFPVPAGDFLNIACPGETLISVFDTGGRLVRTIEAGPFVKQADISSLPPGTYLLKAATGGTLRILKQ